MQVKLIHPISKNQVNGKWHDTLTSSKTRTSQFYWMTHSEEWMLFIAQYFRISNNPVASPFVSSINKMETPKKQH